MWRKVFLASASILTLAGPAFAADLPVAPPPPPVFTWTGVYAGAYGGGEITRTSYATLAGGAPFAGPSYLTPADAASVSLAASQTVSKGGFTAGVQLGYNYQVGLFVLGFETDIGGVTGSTRTTNGGVLSTGAFFLTDQKIDNGLFGTVRGRLGIALDRALIYGTGGFAYSSGSYAFNYADSFPAVGFASEGVKTGWVVGGGIEYGLTNNVSMKGELLYSQFGRITAAGSIVDLTGTGASSTFVTSGRVQEYSARLGLNYRFAWAPPIPVVAKY